MQIFPYLSHLHQYRYLKYFAKTLLGTWQSGRRGVAAVVGCFPVYRFLLLQQWLRVVQTSVTAFQHLFVQYAERESSTVHRGAALLFFTSMCEYEIKGNGSFYRLRCMR